MYTHLDDPLDNLSDFGEIFGNKGLSIFSSFEALAALESEISNN